MAKDLKLLLPSWKPQRCGASHHLIQHTLRPPRPGYMIHDRTLRAAKVGVTKCPEAQGRVMRWAKDLAGMPNTP